MPEDTVTGVGRFACRVGERLGVDAQTLTLLRSARAVDGEFDPRRPGPPRRWQDDPPAARVMQVVDAYLSMVQEREDRSGLHPAYALSCLHRLSPSHFDPRVVLAFCEVFGGVPDRA